MIRIRPLLRASALIITFFLALTTVSPAQAAPKVSEQQARLARIKALLPADSANVRQLVADLDGINPDHYACNKEETSPWFAKQRRTLSPDDLEFVPIASNILSVDLVYTADPDDPFYQPRGDVKRMERVFQGAMGFWNVKLPGTRYLAIHSEAILDADRITPPIALMYPDLAGADLAAAVEEVVAYAANSKGLNYGRHPLLSYNAFSAETSTGIPVVVVGDGMIQANDEMGWGDVGSRFVLAHEVAHNVQAAGGGYEGFPGTPAATRRMELMADALAAYYPAHPRGPSMQAKRIAEASVAAHSVGDCFFEDPDHHGTPNQRKRAALWGASMAANARPKSTILTYQQLRDAFDKQLPLIVAPDAR